MPVDSKGNALNEGDMVTLQARIVDLSPVDEYCNVRIESIAPLYPEEYYSTFSNVNTRQLTKVEVPQCE